MRTIYPAILTVMLAMFLVAACGGGTGTPTEESVIAADVPASLPLWRYVNSGWVSPTDNQNSNAFSRELRGAVITSAEEMAEFNRAAVSKRTNGTSTTLSRAEFPGSVVLAVYLLWLPVQGDPLTVVGMEIEGNRVVVQLELEENAQGRAYPYLFAPMTMVTIDRSDLPNPGPVEFEFRLDDETTVTVTDSLE